MLDLDPGLAEQLEPGDARLAAHSAVADVLVVAEGAWCPREVADPEGLGLLLLSGFMARRVEVMGRHCAELLGPGELVRPWGPLVPEASISQEISWDALVDCRLAILDRRFVESIRPWPQVFSALVKRTVERSQWLAFHLALCGLPGVDRRLLAALWAWADRWGRVTGRGVVLQLPIKQAVLASVVGSSRQTVSSRLADLERRGRIAREGGAWVLKGEPPAEAAVSAR